jgi:GAF domain-containing protein/two-component sensor histidine kinase
VQLRSATERASLAEEHAALRRVATLVAQGATATELFAAVAQEVVEVLGFGTVTVDRYEVDGTSTVVAAWGDGHFPVGSRWPLDGTSLVGTVLATGRSARIDDYPSELIDANGSVVQDVPFVSTVGVPIVVEGAMWGAICVGTSLAVDMPADTEARLASFTELVATAIANAKSRGELSASEARARELADEQAALRRVATLVAGGATSTALFDAVAREVAQLFQFTPSLVARYEDDGATLTVLAICGARPASFAPGSRWPLDGPTVAAEVLRTGRPVRLEDYTEIPGTLAREAREHGWTRTAGAPIIVNGRVWGLVAASGPPDEPLPENLEDRLAEFTQLVATAIANSQANEEVTRLADEQAALRRVATLVARGVRPLEVFSAVSEEVGRVFASPYAGVARFELDGSGVVILGVSEGISNIPIGTKWPLEEFLATTAVYRTGRPARNERGDWKDSPGPVADRLRELGLVSTVAAPIAVEGNVWGVITVSDAHQRLPSDAEERLAAFAELVATAIANAETRADLAASEARARALASEQAALRRVATLVAEGASPDELFSAVAREVAGIIDIPVVGIHRYDPDGTVTTLGIAGETSLTIGTRLPVTDGGIARKILSTGLPSRIDDYTSVPLDAVREDLRLPMVGVPIVVEGSVWGFMVATDNSGRPVPADTEERLARFTELVATAVSNATTRTELLTSRARVVSAADETRRRLERDLHDGIQQWLVGLALRARKAASLSAADKSAVRELSGLADDLVAVTDELREISRGIHPAILTDAGLDDALGALARRSAIRVDLDVSFQGRYDPALEATVYYVAAESITNAVKHAQASTVRVRGGCRNGAIELEIRDNGVGGADPRGGTGLIGLKDRVEALGGTISFASPAGDGTTVRMTLPAGLRDGERPPLARADEAD